MDTAIVVFTRDLRLHDNPALYQACVRARQVVPLFVIDPAIAAPPNRARFLAESLADLRASLRERGADLILRRGDPAAEVIRLAGAVHATAVYIADDVPELAGLDPAWIQTPWRLPPAQRVRMGYPGPLVELA